MTRRRREGVKNLKKYMSFMDGPLSSYLFFLANFRTFKSFYWHWKTNWLERNGKKVLFSYIYVKCVVLNFRVVTKYSREKKLNLTWSAHVKFFLANFRSYKILLTLKSELIGIEKEKSLYVATPFVNDSLTLSTIGKNLKTKCTWGGKFWISKKRVNSESTVPNKNCTFISTFFSLLWYTN